MTQGSVVNAAGVSAVQATGGTGGGDPFTQFGTGAVTTDVSTKALESFSVMDFMTDAMKTDVRSGSPTLDHTSAIQAAINAALASTTIRSVFFPDGSYKVTSSLNVGTSTAVNVTGLRFFGNSYQGVTITQYTNNTPLWNITGNYINLLIWENMTLNFNTQQTIAQTNGNIFQVNGTGAGSMYECVWRNISSQNFYLFQNCTSTTWWGNAYRDCWFGNCSYGINNITAAAGEPRCVFDNIYCTPNLASGVLFTHSSMTATYSVEVNAANGGATMLYDGGGGTHMIKHWALEVGTYATAQNNATLFNVPNGVIIADYIYMNTLTINTGVTIWGFSANGAQSYFDIKLVEGGNWTNNGTFYATSANSCIRCHFGNIFLPWGANCMLTWEGGSTAADFTCVDEWNDPGGTGFLANANATLTYNSPSTQILDVALTAARTITIPDQTTVPDNLFSGRRFTFIRTINSTGAFTVTIKSTNGTTIATIPAAAGYRLELMWQRTGQVSGQTWIILLATSAV